MPKRPKLRITQTLLSSWLGSFKYDTGYDDFICTLNREKKQPTKAMLDGIKFENCVNNVLDGATIDETHEWYGVVTELAEYLAGAQKQVHLFRDIVVDGQPILLHGVLDFLKAGVIYDTKYSVSTKNSRGYYLNKYLGSPQTPMYLALVPEARRFEYLVSDGEWVYKEVYPREIVPPIEPTIKQFLIYLDKHDLMKIYEEKWRVK